MNQKVKIKICGITNIEDALNAAEAGADYLGYILNYEKSARYIEPVRAEEIITQVRFKHPRVNHVGVFVNEKPEIINSLIIKLHLDTVQLHGDESIEDIQTLRRVKKWKAFEIKERKELEKISPYTEYVDAILLDAGKGSGKTIASELLADLRLRSPLVLAGGISPTNIAAAIRQYQPQIVDISTGVESEPGKKDKDKIEQLFNNIR